MAGAAYVGDEIVVFVHLGAYDRAGTIFRADPVTQIFVEREFRLHSPPDWRERKDTATLKDVMTSARRALRK